MSLRDPEFLVGAFFVLIVAFDFGRYVGGTERVVQECAQWTLDGRRLIEKRINTDYTPTSCRYEAPQPQGRKK